MPFETMLPPPEPLIRVAVAAVWLYEGLWCKLLGREPRQLEVVGAVGAVPLGRRFLWSLGLVEVGIAVWVLSGFQPAYCALAQTALLVGLNSGGLLWARHIIHDPAGMVVKNFCFLLLAWVDAALQVGQR